MSKRSNPTPTDRVMTIKNEHVDCRVYQHAWRPTNVTIDGKCFVQELQCRRCLTEKSFRINKFTGEIVGSPRYKYAEGYVIPGGRFTPTERGSVRLVAVQQTPRRIAAQKRRGA